MAILEGNRKYLTEQHVLREEFNQVPLFIRPQSFFQTNPIVAAKLYQTAREWVKALDIHSLGICFVAWAALGCTVLKKTLT